MLRAAHASLAMPTRPLRRESCPHFHAEPARNIEILAPARVIVAVASPGARYGCLLPDSYPCFELAFSHLARANFLGPPNACAMGTRSDAARSH